MAIDRAAELTPKQYQDAMDGSWKKEHCQMNVDRQRKQEIDYDLKRSGPGWIRNVTEQDREPFEQ